MKRYYKFIIPLFSILFLISIATAYLVTDGGFAAVTEGANLLVGNDTHFNTGLGNWPTGNTWASQTNPAANMALAASAAGENCHVAGVLSVGRAHKLTYTASGIVGTPAFRNWNGSTMVLIATIVDGTNSLYFNVVAGSFTSLYIIAGTDADKVTLDNIIILPVTLTSWTAGAGWGPQAVAGALTGKAVKVAGTASDLEQDISAKATWRYYLSYTATRTAGTVTPQIGGVDGTAISASGTYSDEIRATGTGNLKFQADAAFAGTIDAVTIAKYKKPNRKILEP